MELIYTSAIFDTPEEILLYDLLNPSMTPLTIQNVSTPFTYGEENKMTITS